MEMVIPPTALLFDKTAQDTDSWWLRLLKAIFPFPKYPAPTNLDVTKGQKASINYILNLAALAGIGGGLSRVALGAGRLVQKPDKNIFAPLTSRQQIPMLGLPSNKENEVEKQAIDLGDVKSDVVDWLQKFINIPQKRLNQTLTPPERAVMGTGIWDNPMTYWLGLPLAVGTGYAGYKGTDKLLDARRKREQQSALQRLKKEYTEAVRQLYKNAKSASTEEILDKLADYNERGIFEKEGQDSATTFRPPWFRKAEGATIGAAAAVAILSAMLSGKLSYDFFNKRRSDIVLSRAMRQRAAQRSGGLIPAYVASADEYDEDLQ